MIVLVLFFELSRSNIRVLTGTLLSLKATVGGILTDLCKKRHVNSACTFIHSVNIVLVLKLLFGLQCLGWLLSGSTMPTGEQLHTCLNLTNAVLQNSQLCVVIGQNDHVTWVCSLTNVVHQVVSACKYLCLMEIFFFSTVSMLVF